jgi:hypothetical protein
MLGLSAEAIHQLQAERFAAFASSGSSSAQMSSPPARASQPVHASCDGQPEPRALYEQIPAPRTRPRRKPNDIFSSGQTWRRLKKCELKKCSAH